jgi:hypothetical protein
LGTIFVARSKALGDWGYDVGLSKHIYKVGFTDGAVKDVVAAGWCGLTDWVLVKKQDGIEGVSEDDIVDRLARKQKMLDPKLYPRLRDVTGIFKMIPGQVENHLLVTRALAGEPELREIKIKPVDIAAYLIANGLA